MDSLLQRDKRLKAGGDQSDDSLDEHHKFEQGNAELSADEVRNKPAMHRFSTRSKIQTDQENHLKEQRLNITRALRHQLTTPMFAGVPNPSGAASVGSPSVADSQDFSETRGML